MEFILRAHHIFCIQGFRGKGYSKEFVYNMEKIVNHLNKNKDIKVKIVKSPDYICLGCPNNVAIDESIKFELDKNYDNMGFCKEEKYIVKLDNLVLKALDIESDLEYRYGDLLSKIEENLTKEKFDDICGECQWYSLGYCKESLLSNL